MSNSWYYDIIRYPVISEKATHMREQGQCAFYVQRAATKKEIADAVESIFKVKVSKVNVISVHGKSRIFRGKKGQCINRKKAIVTLQDKTNVPDIVVGV